MNKMAIRVTVMLVLVQLIAGSAFSEGEIYFARCNLRVVKGTYISWENWQSAPTFIPVNTGLRMILKGSKASFIDVNSGSKYELDIGAEGDLYLEKFVTKKRVRLDKYPRDVKSNIQNAVARVGMTKEQVYIAMGPPTIAGSERTKKLTYEEIMRSDLWIYARRRFSKNIGVSFDPATGKVNRTEAMLR